MFSGVFWKHPLQTTQPPPLQIFILMNFMLEKSDEKDGC